MKVIHVLRTDWGDIECPPDMIVPKDKRRKDGQPDRRFKWSREWWRRFDEISEVVRKRYEVAC